MLVIDKSVWISVFRDRIGKEQNFESVNAQLIQQLQPKAVSIVKYVEEAELDEMWSFVGSKQQQR